MNSKLFGFLQVIFVLIINIYLSNKRVLKTHYSKIYAIFLASAQTCRVIGAMMTPGSYNVAQQSSDGTGFCVEHVVGPISTSQVFF